MESIIILYIFGSHTHASYTIVSAHPFFNISEYIVLQNICLQTWTYTHLPLIQDKHINLWSKCEKRLIFVNLMALIDGLSS